LADRSHPRPIPALKRDVEPHIVIAAIAILPAPAAQIATWIWAALRRQAEDWTEGLSGLATERIAPIPKRQSGPRRQPGHEFQGVGIAPAEPVRSSPNDAIPADRPEERAER